MRCIENKISNLIICNFEEKKESHNLELQKKNNRIVS